MKLNLRFPFLLFFFSISTVINAQLATIKAPPKSPEAEMFEIKAPGDYDLTDQERYESQTYFHEGKSIREMREACDKLKDPNACRGNGKTKFMGIDSTIVQAVAKAYSMFAGMLTLSGNKDMGFKSKNSGSKSEGGSSSGESGGESSGGESGSSSESGNSGEGQGADNNAEGKEESEGKKDYCALIPPAGEAVASFVQKSETDHINSTLDKGKETPQKRELYKAARSHKTREKTAKIQSTVWGATAACYAGYMAFGNIALDWKIIAKAAAATFLWRFWASEAKQQAKFAEEVLAIADGLPGIGDCNPHTEKHCYCVQPETQYDPKHCLPQYRSKTNIATKEDSYVVPCVDGVGGVDETCECIDTNSCFDKEYFTSFDGPGFVKFANSPEGNNFRKLTRGELAGGKLASGNTGNSAKARRLLAELSSKNTKNPNISPRDKEVSKRFEDYGVPGNLARLLASQRIAPSAQQKASAVRSGNSFDRGRYSRRNGRKRSNILSFSNGLGAIGKKRKANKSNYKNMFKKYNKKGNRSSPNVLRFAQKAERKAQITRNKDRAIFEIISRRYKVSGWRRLEIE